MNLYKLTAPDGSPVHGGRGKWSLPEGRRRGEWREVEGDLIPCQNGLHVLRRKDIVNWLRWPAALWEVEVEGERVVDENKVVVRRARLVKPVSTYTEKNMRLFAADCAEHVLPIFEKKYPTDKRPRETIAVARRYAEGRAMVEELRDAYAAAAAAADAAYAAAASAAAAEREWQERRLSRYLFGGKQ